MKNLLVVACLFLSFNVFSEELEYRGCSQQDIDSLGTVASLDPKPISDIVLNLVAGLDVADCEVAIPVRYYPAVCDYPISQDSHYKIKTLEGRFKIVSTTSRVSCRPRMGATSKITSLESQVK